MRTATPKSYDDDDDDTIHLRVILLSFSFFFSSDRGVKYYLLSGFIKLIWTFICKFLFPFNTRRMCAVLMAAQSGFASDCCVRGVLCIEFYMRRRMLCRKELYNCII